LIRSLFSHLDAFSAVQYVEGNQSHEGGYSMGFRSFRRPLLSSVVALAALVGFSGAASAAVYPSVPVVPQVSAIVGVVANPACGTLASTIVSFPAGAGPVIKTIERSDNANGSSDFKVTLTGPIPTAFTGGLALDCVWIDTNANGSFDGGETAKAYLSTTPITIGGIGALRTMIFQINVPAASGVQVCDRAFGGTASLLGSALTSTSGLASGSWAALYSGSVCSAPTPSPVVPEAPYVPMLLGSAGAMAAGVLYLSRRNRTSLI
jgi:hypothetical protein